MRLIKATLPRSTMVPEAEKDRHDLRHYHLLRLHPAIAAIGNNQFYPATCTLYIISLHLIRLTSRKTIAISIGPRRHHDQTRR